MNYDERIESVAKAMWENRCIPLLEIHPRNTWDKADPVARDIFLQQARAADKAVLEAIEEIDSSMEDAYDTVGQWDGHDATGRSRMVKDLPRKHWRAMHAAISKV